MLQSYSRNVILHWWVLDASRCLEQSYSNLTQANTDGHASLLLALQSIC